MASLTQRMLGAAKLDAATYEEVEADTTATPQAMLVVVLASVASGLGVLRAVGVGGLLTGALASLIGWYVWAFITYFVGTRLLPDRRRRRDGQLLRPSASRRSGADWSSASFRLTPLFPWPRVDAGNHGRGGAPGLDYESTDGQRRLRDRAHLRLLVLVLLSSSGVPLDGAP
jgi:hypothetical protein